MFNDTLLAIAKRVWRGECEPVFSKTDFYTEITKRAETARRVGESFSQAFARYVTEEPDGKMLYCAYKRAGGPPPRPEPRPAPERRTVEPGQACKKLMRLADAERAAHPELRQAQAFAKVYEDPRNGELVAAERAERRAAK